MLKMSSTIKTLLIPLMSPGMLTSLVSPLSALWPPELAPLPLKYWP